MMYCIDVLNNGVWYMSRVMGKPALLICENKEAEQLLNAFVFPNQTVQPLNFLKPKFQK